MFPYAFVCVLSLGYVLYIRAYERAVHAKKPAKVLLFFDMTKYFLKKMQKKSFFL